MSRYKIIQTLVQTANLWKAGANYSQVLCLQVQFISSHPVPKYVSWKSCNSLKCFWNHHMSLVALRCLPCRFEWGVGSKFTRKVRLSISWRMDHPRARSFLKTRVYSKHSAAAVQTRDQARGSCGFVSSVVWSEVSREGFFRCQFFIVQFEIVWILPHTLQQGQFVPTGYCKWLWLRVKQTPTIAFYWVIQNFHFLHTVCVLSFLLLCTVSQSVFPIGFNGEMEFWKMTWECHWNWS